MVAGDAVAKAAADGYTLLLSSSSYTANAVLQPKMPYDLTTDLTPVNLIATIPIVVVYMLGQRYFIRGMVSGAVK